MASPAAVLSILVQVNGAQQAAGQLGNVNSAASNAHGTLSKLGKVAAVGLAAGIGAGVVAVKGFVKAASESEVSATKMQTQLKALGIDYGKHAKQIDAVIQKHSQLAGVDDEDLQDAFTTIVRSTGKVSVALKDMGLVTDLARGKNMDLGKAGDLLAKVHSGNVGALKRLGIAIDPVTKAQDALRESSKHATVQQKRAAKEADKTATSQKAIAELQKKFGGQAEAYGKTAAGAQERFKVAVENVQEAIGAKLLPILAKVAGKVADFVTGMSSGEGAGGKFAATLKGIADAGGDVIAWGERNKTLLTDIAILVGTAVAAFTAYKVAVALNAAATVAWTVATTALGTAATIARAPMLALALAFQANPVMLIVTALALLVGGIILAYKHSETFRDIVNGVWTAIKSVAQPVIEWLATAIPAAWEAIKTATTAVWDFLQPYLATAFEIIKTAVVTYFKVYWTVISGIWDAIKAVTTTLWDWFGPYIKGIWEIVKTAVSIYFNAFKTIISGVWDAIKTAAGVAWDAIKVTIIDPIKEAKKIIGEIWDAIKRTADKAWEKLTTAAGTFASGLKSAITTAFRDAANLVVGFVNKIIDVVNKIPGVNIKHVAEIAGGGSGGNAASRTGAGDVGLARGGAFARTGGMLNSPMVFMGEEAPRHPEFVIPTNPAYRKRAQGLLAQAAGAVGFQAGGKWGVGALEGLWKSAGGAGSLAHTMAIIATAESGAVGQYGNQFAHNPSGATGLWQILGSLVPGDLYDAMVNAKNAVAKYATQGLGAWAASRSVWEPALKGGGGILDKIGGVVGDVVSALNPLDLIKKLPGTGGLGWLGGLGKYALGKVGDWIKDKVTGLFPGGGGGDVGGLVPRVLKALAFARSHGWHGTVTSGYRSIAEQQYLWDHATELGLIRGKTVARPGSSSHQSGQAVDITDIPGFARAMAMMPASDRLYNLVPGDAVHFSVSGHAKGTAGASKGWAWVGERGPELVNFRGGEKVLSNPDSMMMAAVMQGYAKGTGKTARARFEFARQQARQREAAALAIAKASDPFRHVNTRGIGPMQGLPTAAVVVDSEPIVDSNQALVDAVNELARLEQVRIDLETVQVQNIQKAYNVSQSQYGILAQAITDVVSRQMGSGLGLGLAGLRAPAGSVSRL